MLSIKEMKDTGRTVWVKYIDEFWVQIRYVDRADLNRMLDTSKEISWDRKDHTRVEKVNNDKFYRKFVKVVLDWRGLTLETLSKMVPITVKEGLDQEVAFSPENALELLSGAHGFDQFVRESCMDLEAFATEAQEEEIKNSQSSQGG